MKYIDVIVDNNSDSTDKPYTYICKDDDVKVGDEVSLPFARSKKEKKGYVFRVKNESQIENLREVYSVNKERAIGEEAVSICLWMRRRYFCRYIEAVKCFLPPGSASKRGKLRTPDHGLEDYESGFPPLPDMVLSRDQEEAVKILTPSIEDEEYKTFLLQGVTGSGKTQVYIEFAKMVLNKGRQLIVLLPEISLTQQVIGRFTEVFGPERVAVMHSRLSQGERHDEWMRIKNEGIQIVIGARSAVFAPVKKLGGIIVDEEHEATYKSDKSPKYDTIEVAIKRGRRNNAPVILGSATPSVVSTYRVSKGLYEKIELSQRYNKIPLPPISLVDMREELKAGNKSIFSRSLFTEIGKTLEDKKQVILFLNRRGYSPSISCRSCGFLLTCKNCGISMTYHKANAYAECHFCGHREKMPSSCPECGSLHISHFGLGTEKIEEITGQMLPNAKTVRLDFDTTGKKGSVNRILNSFKKGRYDILIGTQMLAKGLDFSNVGLVGVVAADVSLNIPDFRSAERTFQLITQVAGRAGRRQDGASVIVQTYMPENYAISAAAAYDYDNYYSNEILLRKSLSYPPFSDIMSIIISATSNESAEIGAQEVYKTLKHLQITEPGQAPIAKIGNSYRYRMHIKVEPSKRRMHEELLMDLKLSINKDKKKKYHLSIEVNPYSFM